MMMYVCFFKQKTAYEMRISDWSSDVCSSDLGDDGEIAVARREGLARRIELARIARRSDRRVERRVEQMVDQHERGEAFEHRHLNVLSLAGSERVNKRRENRLRPELSCDLVGDQGWEIARSRSPIDARQQAGGAARRLDDVVIGLQAGIGAILPKSGAMDIDDVGFDRAASVIIEAEPRDRLAADVVEKDVGGGDQVAKHRRVFGLFQARKSTRLNSSH